MHLRHCRAAPALTRPRTHDVAALHHSIRTFHISAPLSDESSSSGRSNNNEPAPLGSARARSAAAATRIQNIAPRYSNTPNTTSNPAPIGANYKQVGLAGGSFKSGQQARQQPSRVISPVRRTDAGGSTTRTSGFGPALKMNDPRTPRIQTRVGGGAGAGAGARGAPPPGQRFGGLGAGRPSPPRGGNFGARGGGGGRGGRRGGARGGSRNNANKKKDDQLDDGDITLSDTVLRYLVSLKAARRTVKTHTPHEHSSAELISHAALSASLGQPGGAVQLLEARLRALAGRPDLSPEPVMGIANRLLRGQFVKFADDAEREAVMAIVAERQELVAVRLSEKAGEEVAPRAIEFEEVGAAVRDATTDAVVAGRYAVQAADMGRLAATAAGRRDVAARVLDLNGSYVGGDRGKFMGRLDALLAVQGSAAAAKPKPTPAQQA